MSRGERAAGAKRGPKSAELRSGTAAAASGQPRTGRNCGKTAESGAVTAERLRKHNVPVSSSSAPAGSAAPGAPASPAAAPSPAAPALVPPSFPAAPREAVPAEPPPPPARRGEWGDDVPPSLARGLPAHEQAVIDAALAILGRRVREPGAVIDAPHLVREFLRLQLAKCQRERFGVLFLDGQHAAIGFEVLFEGTLTQTSVYPREVARRALQLNAAAVILVHNHPSGTAEPSLADEHLTSAMRQSLGLVDVRVLDHVVVGWPEVASMAERGLMEPEPRPWPPSRRTARVARGVAEAHAALRVAFELLSPEDRAADLADATIALAKLPLAPGAARDDTEPGEG